MKKIICFVLSVSVFAISPLLLADPVPASITVANGILNSNPELSPTLNVDLFDGSNATACSNTTVDKAPTSLRIYPDSPYYTRCEKVAYIVITPQSVVKGVWEPVKQTISYGASGGVFVVIKTKTMPVFNPDGSVKTPGTIESTLTPYLSK